MRDRTLSSEEQILVEQRAQEIAVVRASWGNAEKLYDAERDALFFFVKNPHATADPRRVFRNCLWNVERRLLRQ